MTIRALLSGDAGPGSGLALARAVAGSAGLRLGGMALGFLVGVQLARGLGTAGYGIYGMAMSIIALLTVPTELGLPQLLTREVASAQAKADWARLRGVIGWSVRTVLWTSLLIATAIVAWTWGYGRDLMPGTNAALLAGLALVPLTALGNVAGATLRGLHHVVSGQISEVVLRPAAFCALLFVASALYGSLTAPVAMALGSAAAGIALGAGLLMTLRRLPVEVSQVRGRADARVWWTSAVPMALTEGMRVLQAHLVILVLGLMAPAATVGLYRVASSTALLLAVPVTLFNIAAAPTLSRLHALGDAHRLQRLLGGIAGGMLIGVVLLWLPFLAAGESLIGLLFGPAYAASAAPLAILGAGVAASAFFGANATLLNMTGHQQQVTRASSIALVLLAVLLPPLIWAGGATGAAVASVLASTAWNALLWHAARTQLGQDTRVVALLRGRHHDVA
ncbi:MAG: oligosaccharide flippase family protein [Dokdonella sp.]|nr:oligosaccharide flippase family protein [Dokdonella sp.]